MVRAALASPRRIGEGPGRFVGYVPAASVVVCSMLAMLPIVSESGWFPDFGFLALISWRLLRADAFPAWWAAPLGLVNDLFTGLPIGFSVALWSATMLALDLIDRRTMWRDYWIEWLLAAGLLALGVFFQWRVAGAVGGAPDLVRAVPVILVSVFVFPLAAWAVSRVDRWRFGR
jgi:rod shape-determining protein MreD